MTGFRNGVIITSKIARNLSTGTVGSGHAYTKIHEPINKTTTVMWADSVERDLDKPPEECCQTVNKMKI